MPTAPNAGGRMNKELKFGEHKNSLGKQLHLPGTDAELRDKDYRNRKAFYAELALKEQWAASGFTAGIPVDNDEGDANYAVV